MASEVAIAYLNYERSSDESFSWAEDRIYELRYSRQFDECWKIVEEFVDLTDDLEELCNFGCGFVEDLVRDDSNLSFERLEALVNTHPNAKTAISCVWAWEAPNRHLIDELMRKYNIEAN